MVLRQTSFARYSLILLAILLLGNALLYHPSFHQGLSIELELGMIIGSLVDMVIVAPILAYAAFKLSKKQLIGLMVLGLVAVRFLVPEELFAPFTMLLYMGLAIEGLVVLVEVGFIIMIIKKIPIIRSEMNSMESGPIFTLIPAVEKKVKNHPIIRFLLSEALVVFYSLFTWRKNPPSHLNVITMHKKTSTIAIFVMMIHAIVIETIAIHWLIHHHFPILSIILLILNIYSVLLILAEIQITRLHPIEVKNKRLFVTQGIMQRCVVDLKDIKEIVWGDIQLKQKDVMYFMSKDFEELNPQVLIQFKEPIQASSFMGRKKWVNNIAIRVDEPEKFKKLLHGCLMEESNEISTTNKLNS